MSLSMNINGMNEVSESAFQAVVRVTGEWIGRIVAWIKIGSDKISPFFQNNWVAGVSVVAVTLILIEIGQAIGRGVDSLLPKGSSVKDWISFSVQISAGVGTIAGGVYAFSRFTNLPLSNAAIAAIALSTVILKAQFHSS